MADREWLKELLAKATPGEWIIFAPAGSSVSIAVFNADDHAQYSGGQYGPAMWHDQVVCAWSARDDNLDFIAAAHNEMASLLSDLESLEALRQAVGRNATSSRAWTDDACIGRARQASAAAAGVAGVGER